MAANLAGVRRSLALLVSIALAAGLVACGGDDDSGSAGSTNAAEARAERAGANAEVRAQNEKTMEEYRERQEAARPTEEEREAEQVATSFYDVLREDSVKSPNRTTIDSTSFCDLMSEEAVAQTIHYAKVSSGIAQKWDCESAVELLVVRSKRTGGFKGTKKATVIGVNAEGDQATATIKFGNGPATSVPLVKEDGEWKLAASPAP